MWFEVRIDVGDQQDHELIHSLVWREPGRDAREVADEELGHTLDEVLRALRDAEGYDVWPEHVGEPVVRVEVSSSAIAEAARHACSGRPDGRVLAIPPVAATYHCAMEDHPEDPRNGGNPEPPVPESDALDELTASFSSRPMSQISVASAKVAAIVEAAERAAEDLRHKTEEKARERIAEADRAGDLRVEAAEAEAREIVDTARRQAAAIEAEAKEGVRLIHERAAQARDDAERRKIGAVQEAQEEATRVRADADAYAEDTRRDAKVTAREIIAEAHDAARGVLHDGTTLSGHLQELSDSLHRNAERLLNDVKLAHARLSADLDQAAPAGAADPAPTASRGTLETPAPTSPRRGPNGDFEVPEFVPGRR